MMLTCRQSFEKLAENLFSKIDYLKDNTSDWQKVFLLNKAASTEYSILTINYHNAYLLTAQDCSFIIYENGIPVAIWPLTLYQVDNIITLQSNCKSIIPPLFICNTSKKIIKKVYQQCFGLLKVFSENSNTKIYTSYSPNNDILWQRTFSPVIKELNYQQYLMADISADICEIKKNFRKSYRSLINKGLQLWQCQLHTHMSDELLTQFRAFHIETAGKDTRSLTTWKMQQSMVNNNEAFCISLHDKDHHLIGIALFNLSPLQASYSVGVYERNLFDLPLGHVIQLKAIEHMKSLGVTRYFLGNRHHLFEKNMPSQKESSIGFFKEGFSNEIYIEANARLIFD